VLIRATSLLILCLLGFGGCVAPAAKSERIDVSALEQSWEVLKIPDAYGDLKQHVLTLVPQARYAQVQSAWHKHTIDVDFHLETPGFQPVQLYRRPGESNDTLYVLGFDMETGSGMVVVVTPLFTDQCAVQLSEVYRGAAFDFPLTIAAHQDFEQTLFLLGASRYIHRLDLADGTFRVVGSPIEYPSLLECNFITCWTSSKLEQTGAYTLFASEAPLTFGCEFNYGFGAYVALQPHPNESRRM
jgi:hypothetical protein